MISVAETVSQVLTALGVRTVFGAAVDDCPLTTALAAQGVRVIAARHPSAATTMAEAYTRTGDQPAVLTASQGSVLTSAITGIMEAAHSRTPLLVLACEPAGGDHSGITRQTALLTAAGALIEPVTDAAETVSIVAWALHATRTQRRPLVLTLARQVLATSCPPPPDNLLAALGDLRAPAPPVPDAEAMTRLTDLLTGARRPVFIAGRGARHAGQELEELAGRTGALLATSAAAHGLFASSHWNLGIAGDWSTPAVAELIHDADVLIGWGCSLHERTTRRGDLIGSGTHVTQVDLDPGMLGVHRSIDFGVAGDASATARALLQKLPTTRTGYRTDEIRRRIDEQSSWHDVSYHPIHIDGRIDPRTLSQLLDALLPAERTLAVDRGDFMSYPIGLVRIPNAQGFCYSQAFEEAGLGLASGIGAALANPGRLAVAALGDAGALRAAAELETAVRLELPLLIVVYNTSDDGPYGLVDLAALATGYGCTATVVRQGRDLKAIGNWLAGPRLGPLLIDARIASVRLSDTATGRTYREAS
ncbi:thiamine pyrophosphate-binding protein [Nonomuraea cavernae]|uniref:Acetolactate synthase I/II/III large subunit n=1 Tax=Nonomuraea cavernae TaxID=2045107 RepID=A0A918DTG2_9ACTN|nr:thiamine pyrophosphate-binding protein [Nonomuraea cavernae]MCA2190611.1 thiamine pyrophosphate-binding protein [Nonomuraea cavernae]GGO81359.1 acetolactate synthase I/II/III large subunit [Nonomuraea cavernae]